MIQRVKFEIKKFEIKNKTKNPKKPLPTSFFFTDRKKISDINCDLKTVIGNLPKNCAIIVREYDLNYNDRKIFAKNIMFWTKLPDIKSLNLKVLIGKNISLAKEVKADGVHFSDFDHLPIESLKKAAFPKEFIFSLSCHSLKSVLSVIDSRIGLKNAFKPDVIFISPIFPTTSHLGKKSLGIRKLSEISLKTKNRAYCGSSIYGLGGVNLSNIPSLRKLNLSGFAAINLFLNHD